MPSTSAEYFQAHTASGSGASWSSLSNLASSSGEAFATFTAYKRDTDTINCTDATAINAISEGSQFVSCTVSYQYKKALGSGTLRARAKLTGGTLYTTSSVVDTMWHTVNLSGDSAYWGLTGTPQQILTGLQDGSIKFELYLTGTGSFPVRVEDITITLTYAEADTKKGAILACQ